jgi:hypothetical protein
MTEPYSTMRGPEEDIDPVVPIDPTDTFTTTGGGTDPDNAGPEIDINP